MADKKPKSRKTAQEKLPIGGGTGPAAVAIHKALADSVDVAVAANGEAGKEKSVRKARGDVERSFAPLAGVMNLNFDPLHETPDSYRKTGNTFIHGMREGLFEAVTVTDAGAVVPVFPEMPPMTAAKLADMYKMLMLTQGKVKAAAPAA